MSIKTAANKLLTEKDKESLLVEKRNELGTGIKSTTLRLREAQRIVDKFKSNKEKMMKKYAIIDKILAEAAFLRKTKEETKKRNSRNDKTGLEKAREILMNLPPEIRDKVLKELETK